MSQNGFWSTCGRLFLAANTQKAIVSCPTWGHLGSFLHAHSAHKHVQRAHAHVTRVNTLISSKLWEIKETSTKTKCFWNVHTFSGHLRALHLDQIGQIARQSACQLHIGRDVHTCYNGYAVTEITRIKENAEMLHSNHTKVQSRAQIAALKKSGPWVRTSRE